MAAAMENTFVGSGTPSLEIQPDWLG